MAELDEIPGIQVQKCHSSIDRHSYYMSVFTCEPEAFGGLTRDQVVTALKAEAIPAFRMYPRIQDTAHFTSVKSTTRHTDHPCPISRHLADHGIWLHHRILLADESLITQTIEAFKRIARYGPDIKRAFSNSTHPL